MDRVSADEDRDERLRPVERLKKRADYLAVQRRGRRRAGEHVIVCLKRNQLGFSRVGVTASKRVGNAVRRNWWKRRVRECFRRNKSKMPVGYDIVVIVKASAEPPEYRELARECVRLAKGAVGGRRRR